MKTGASLALTAAIIASMFAITAAEFDRCSWKINMGRDAVDPMLAPAGTHQYIITVRNDEGRRAVAKALRDLDSAEITSVREMPALANFLTAKLSRAAVRWACRSEALEKHIQALELDQKISIYDPK